MTDKELIRIRDNPPAETEAAGGDGGRYQGSAAAGG